MDIRTFHLHYIEGQTEEPWADALRRLCAYRHDGTLTDATRDGATDGSAPLAAWTIWHESEASEAPVALRSWMPWGEGQDTTASLRGWAMWDGVEPTPRTE